MSNPVRDEPEWELTADADLFASQRNNPALHDALTLARIVNAARFCLTVVAEAQSKSDSRTTRQRSSALFYLGALLFEALDDAAECRARLQSYASWPKLQALLEADDTKSLKAGLLKRLRNEAVFHFADAVVPEGIRNITGASAVFASGRGRLKIEAYYDLADIVTMYYVLGSPASQDAFAEAAQDALMAIGKLGTELAHACDELIRDVLRGLGWSIRGAAA